MARAIKWILVILFICGILYAAYRYLTREDEFEAFDDDDFDFDRDVDDSILGRIKSKAKEVLNF